MDHELKKYIRKTGTTTLGIVCKDGVLLAADRKGIYADSGGGVVYNAAKDEQKIEQVNDNVIVTTAGVASDLQKVIKIVRSELKLKELKSKKKPSIKESANLFAAIAYQNIRQFSAIPGITHFLLAGWDDKGVYLYDVHPDGYIKEIKKYSSTGSGMMHVNPILDSEYEEEMNLKQGIELAKKAVNASSNRDPASGEGIDVFTITKEGIKQVLSQEAVVQLKNRE